MPEYFCLPIDDVPTGTVRYQAIDDPVGANDGDGTRLGRASTTGNSDYLFQKQSLPALASIAWVELRYIAEQEHVGSVFATIKPYLFIGTTKYYATEITPTDGFYTVYVFRWTVNPATGLFWTKGGFEAAQLGFEMPRDEGEFNSMQFITSAYFAVDAIPAEPGKSREIGTAYLNAVRRSIEFMSLTTSHLILDNEIMDDLSLFHIQHPITQILGELDHRGVMRTGAEGWRSLLVQWRDLKIDLNTLAVDITLRRRRDELSTFLDGGQSRVSAASMENGVEFLIAGGTKSYTRASMAWHPDPVTGLVVPFANNERPISNEGFTPENLGKNWILNSSFVTDLTNITRSGSGTSVRETSPPEPLFHADVSPACLKMTAGNPHSTEQANEWTVNPDKAMLLRFSIDHKDDSGALLEWRIRRSDTGEYVNDSSGGWTGSSTWNALPIVTTRTRHKSTFIIDLDAATTLLVRVRQASGGTVSRVNRIYHAQLEENGFGIMTSRVVTPSSVTNTRAIQLFGGTNNTGKRSFNNAYGTAFFEVIPHWTAEEMAISGGSPPIMRIIHDSNDSWRLFYNSVAGNRVDFVSERSIVLTTATTPYTPVFGELARVAIRWIPINESMFGLPAGTISVFMNGVKGSDAVRAANPLEESPNMMYIGTGEDGVAWNGVVRQSRITAQIYSDEEIAAFTW